VFCLLSDGEWNEGSNWESLMFIAHHRLREVVLLVDLNGLQGFGATAEVANLGSLANKLKSLASRFAKSTDTIRTPSSKR